MVFVCLSVFLHLGCLAGGMLFQGFQMSRPVAKVVRVDLVSFSPGVAEPAALAPSQAPSVPGADVGVAQPEPVPKAEPQPEVIPSIKPDVSLKSKPKNLKKLMAEKTKPKKKAPSKKLKPKSKVDAEKELKKARRDLAKRVEAEKEKQLAQAFERLRDTVASEGTQAQGVPGSGSGKGRGRAPTSAEELYKTIIQSAIEQNWVFNETLARMDQGLETRILIKILRSGEIRDIIFSTRSGNRYLDESAKKAIQRANPLPRLPQGRTSWDMVIVFTPKGLR